MKEPIEKKIAKLIRDAGGTTYYTGGYVRDKLLGIENKDIDIEVHGIQSDVLYGILKSLGTPLSYGVSFGIYSLAGYDIDIALPRREYAIGKGHRDFEIDVDPYIGVEKAARRRDFTINAMMEDVLTGEIIDVYGGKADLEAKVLRHVDADTFVEDPLRVLRLAQFAARFKFDIAEETINLCRCMDISQLSHERVEGELKKALLKAENPSVFFDVLRKIDGLNVFFPEIESLIGLVQDPIYHPEGDCWIHTMQVLDNAVRYRDKVSDAYSFMLLALCHDLGKVITTEEKNGRVHSYYHEYEGVKIAQKFLKRLGVPNSVMKYVINMIPLHMRPNVVSKAQSSIKATNKMYDSAIAKEDLIYFSACDMSSDTREKESKYNMEFLFDRLKQYNEIMAKPYVKAIDLMEAGIREGEEMGELLKYAHKLRLAGIEKEDALKQTLSYAKK